MRKFNKIGQNLTEFALCLSIITAAIVTLQIYVRLSLQAKYKAGADYVVSQIGKGKAQYHPYYQESGTLEEKDNKTTSGFPTMSIDSSTKRSGWQYTASAADAD